MRNEAPGLALKGGFVSLVVWKSEKDDFRVLVEGRWVSQAYFDAAVADNAPALESRSRLEKFAKPAPGLFSECFRVEGKPKDGSHLGALLKRHLRPRRKDRARSALIRPEPCCRP